MGKVDGGGGECVCVREKGSGSFWILCANKVRQVTSLVDFILHLKSVTLFFRISTKISPD